MNKLKLYLYYKKLGYSRKQRRYWKQFKFEGLTVSDQKMFADKHLT